MPSPDQIADMVRRVREAAEASRLGLVHLGDEFLETLADALEHQARELAACESAVRGYGKMLRLLDDELTRSVGTGADSRHALFKDAIEILRTWSAVRVAL